jgi:hypothetical protein
MNLKKKKFIDKDLSSKDKNKINNNYYENINFNRLNNINTKLKK